MTNWLGWSARRTSAGQELPPYYLVHFLLIDFLGFPNLGQREKVSWSIPIDYEGRVFLIEHRKLGLGIFCDDPNSGEDTARAIVTRVQKAVGVAHRFFDWLADEAVAASKVNVVNRSPQLFDRYRFLLNC